MVSEAAAFRRRFGVSPDQHFVLTRCMKNDTITRGQLGKCMVNQVHRLVDYGFLTYVASTTDIPWNDSWHLTDAGRDLLKRW